MYNAAPFGTIQLNINSFDVRLDTIPDTFFISLRVFNPSAVKVFDTQNVINAARDADNRIIVSVPDLIQDTIYTLQTILLANSGTFVSDLFPYKTDTPPLPEFPPRPIVSWNIRTLNPNFNAANVRNLENE